jgi:hypothetical protein
VRPDAGEQRSARVEDVDEAVTLACDIVVAVGLLLGIRDDDLPADVLEPNGA